MLATAALTLQLARDAVDRGSDAAAGRRRCCKKQRQPMQVAGSGAMRIRRLRKPSAMAREAKGLWGTGASPQATYCHRLQGLAPSRIKQLRQQAGGAVGGQVGGRCFLAVLAVELEEDPALKLRTQLFDSWLGL